jgi:hypothetical protein
MPRVLAACLTLLLSSAGLAFAQQTVIIHVLLLNGNNGKPLQIGNDGKEGGTLSLVISADCGSAGVCFFPNKQLAWAVDRNGHADLPVIAKLKSVELSRPTDKLIYCQGAPDKYGALSQDPEFPVDEILRRGIVAPNICNSGLHIQPQPGQLVFFLRPLTWWEILVKPPQM